MKTLTIVWKSETPKGFWFGVKELVGGFYYKYTVEVDQETYASLPEIGEEITVPAAALS